MRQEVINIYRFDELSEDVQQKVIERLYDINLHNQWYEDTFDYFREKYGELFDIDKIYFSGFYSQGDGAMFTYSGIGEELENEFAKLLDFRERVVFANCYTNASGKHRGYYYHENSCEHYIDLHEDFDTYYFPNCSNLVDKIAPAWDEFVEDRYVDICREMYRTLEEEYDYLTSKECIIETIEVNEYEFTEDGKFA